MANGTCENNNVVYQDVYRVFGPRDKFRGIVSIFGFIDATLQVALENFLTPRTICWVGYRSESRSGAVLLCCEILEGRSDQN